MPYDHTLSNHAEKRLAKRGITRNMIQHVLDEAVEEEPNPEGPRDSTRAYAPIFEKYGRVLCVVYNSATTPDAVITAMWDDARTRAWKKHGRRRR